MTEDAVKRAIHCATRVAFGMGIQASKSPSREREALKQQAVLYAEELVMAIVEMAIQEATEQQRIDNHGKRNSAPDVTI